MRRCTYRCSSLSPGIAFPDFVSTSRFHLSTSVRQCWTAWDGTRILKTARPLRPALRATCGACALRETDEPYQTARWSPLRALISWPLKYIRSPKAELYDLLKDPHELHNLCRRRTSAANGNLSAEWAFVASVTLTNRERRVLNSLGYSARSQIPPGEDKVRCGMSKTCLPFTTSSMMQMR